MTRIFLYENLDPQKQRNVVNSFSNGKEIGEVLFVVDDTLFGSCKDGVVVSEKYVIAKNMFLDPVFYPIDHFTKVFCKDKKLILNGIVIKTFSVPESDELEGFFSELEGFFNEIIEHRHEREKKEARAREMDVAMTEVTKNEELKQKSEIDIVLDNINAMLIVLEKRAYGVESGTKLLNTLADIEFMRKILSLSKSLHSRLSAEAIKHHSEQRDLFNAEAIQYIATLTYVSAYVYFVVKSKFGRDFTQAMRYAQFSFLLTGALQEMEVGNKKNVCSLDVKWFEDFVHYFERRVHTGVVYLRILSEVINSEDKRLVEIRRATQNLAANEEFNSFVDKELIVFEGEVEGELIKLVTFYGKTGECPRQRNIETPSEFYFITNTDGMKNRD